MKAAVLIKRSRLQAGLTQAGLAERLGTVQPVVARWESGARSPSFESVMRVIHACGLTPTMQLEPYDPGEEAHFRLWQALTPLERLRRNEQMLEFEKWARSLRKIER